MDQDARFEDGDARPLRLIAQTEEDLQVISSLVQDAVCPASEMKWRGAERRFAILLNRFRWEENVTITRTGRPPERVQSLLVIDDAMHAATQGVNPGDADMVLSLLTMSFEPSQDGSGAMILTFAGDGAIKIDVEAINITLQDVTRPYVAPSGKSPRHPD